MMRALVIRPEHLDNILSRRKTWEIRGSRTTVRGEIGLIASGSGTVVGVCDLVGCIGPLTAGEFRKNARKAGLRPGEATLGHYRHTYAWVVDKPKRLRHPVPYKHPSGAVIWVRLKTAVERRIRRQASPPGRAD